MGYESVKVLVDQAYEEGRHWYTGFRFAPTIASSQALWYDLSQSYGTPYPNVYAGTPYTATLLSSNSGIYHGGSVSPRQKFLHKMTIQSVNSGVVPARLILADFLMFYPYIDMANPGPMPLSNPITLPRYADGKGVYMFMAAMGGAYTGTGNVWVSYVDADDNVTKTNLQAISTSNLQGTLIHTGAGRGPFMQIQKSTGVKYATEVEFSAVSTGMVVLVLARPIAEIFIREITAPVEFDFIIDKPRPPLIYDGADLHFLIAPNGSMASTAIQGDMTVIW